MDIKYNQVELGLYDYMSSRYDRIKNIQYSLNDFLSFDISLQKMIINTDIASLRDYINKNIEKKILTEYEIRDKSGKTREYEYINSVDAKEVVTLLSEEKSKPIEVQKEEYFNMVFSLIYQKRSNYNPKEKNNADDKKIPDESGIGLSRKHENKVVSEIKLQDEEIDVLPSFILSKKEAKLCGLSEVEYDCFKYLSDRNFTSILSTMFTKNGIIQQANKASMKILLNSEKLRLFHSQKNTA